MKSYDTVRPVRGAIALLVGIGLFAAGCSDGDGLAADPTVPTAAVTTPTSTTTVPDVSSIPATIDEPYLNAVLAALDEVDGQATRLIYASKKFTPEAADLLNAIYSDAAFEFEVQGWVVSLSDDAELRDVRPNPGNRRTTVDRVIASSATCVWLAVRRDYSARNVGTAPDRLEYVAMERLDVSNDPADTNPTAWMVTADGFRQDGQEPTNPCPAG